MMDDANDRSIRDAYYHFSPSGEELLRRYNSGERSFYDLDIEDKSDLHNAYLAGAVFEKCMLSDLDLQNANLQNVRFVDCNVKCTDFRGADLTGATFTGCSMESTYFEGANLTDVSFAGSYVMSYKLTEEDMPDANGQF